VFLFNINVNWIERKDKKERDRYIDREGRKGEEGRYDTKRTILQNIARYISAHTLTHTYTHTHTHTHIHTHTYTHTHTHTDRERKRKEGERVTHHSRAFWSIIS